ncbi:uncharacterized protein TNCV_3183581 [Trichonephila clavipes]|uniref:Uncharacterized protein n=1 Tax=Trichonephila clavipes TaxID=2585209 RepID=A0A8X6SHX6_TRICX|nr:uncharacterized protein TNCV_3183581 [Trichonephila clavipes]
MVSVQHLLDQCRQRTTIVFGNLGRWPDRVTYYEPDYPYTILFEPNFGVHIPRSFGKTVIVFTSHLDLTWDKGVELRFFQLGHPHSHRDWEAYQPQTTDAYSLNLTDCPRVREMVDVVGRLENASRRSCSLAHGGSPTLEAGFGTTRAALA